VVFRDPSNARRAFLSMGRAIPRVSGVPPVPEVWRAGLRAIVKGRSDKWAKKGSTTEFWMRPARSGDTEANAVSTAGAKTHGLLGERLRKEEIQRRRRERLERARAKEEARQRLMLATAQDERVVRPSSLGRDHRVVVGGKLSGVGRKLQRKVSATATAAPPAEDLPPISLVSGPASDLPPISFKAARPAKRERDEEASSSDKRVKAAAEDTEMPA
jgi:hypothetical protein